ncbi:MAG: PQQ-binding-like beta-propeller repeat protein [Gemmataceae bacterium]|nr:PQQ-binding-like beta-propeller repeat protein [Gemmataceae bacterium]
MRITLNTLLTALLLVLLGAWPAATQAPPATPQPASAQPAGPARPPADTPPDTTATDERILRDVKEGTDGPALLEYLRKRTYPEPDPKKLQQLVLDLSSRLFKVREKAHSDLIALGPSALPVVRQAERSPEDEVRKRALDIRQHIEQKADPAVQAAVARLIAVRKPAGAAAVLLAYLPFSADESVADEFCRALPAVTRAGGKTDPVVIAALADKLAVKRGAAGAALVQAGADAELPAVRKLLADTDPSVRLRVALALVAHKREKEAVEPLIGTLAHLAPERLWPAEEMLIRLAGEKAPQVSLGSDEPSRQRARQLWSEWWERNKGNINLAKADLTQQFLGYTILVQRTFNRVVNGKRLPASGLVVELDSNRKERWKIELPTFPVSAEVIGPDRVLVAEYQGGNVTIRDFKGKVQWQKAVGGNPLSAHRLPSGNVFVVMQNRLAEFDAKGTQVWNMDRPTSDIFRGKKLRTGEVVFITAQGLLTRLDPKTNKTLVSFNVGPMGSQFGTFEVLSNGNYLIPVYGGGRVVEFDPKGQQVWQAPFQWPTSAQRLPNGNTLVTSQIGRRVAELDRKGKELWSHAVEGQVYTAQRR